MGAPAIVQDMVRIEGGEFQMGSEAFYPEERPVRRVEVDGFWIDQHPVSAAEFRRFVRETGYVTVAERPLDPDDYPDADPELLVPGLPRLPQDGRAGAAERRPQLVGVRARCLLEEAGWAGHDDQWPRSASGRAGRL